MNWPRVREAARVAADRFTWGVRHIPQFAAVSLPSPQPAVTVTLESPSLRRDVTASTVAVSLEPLRIGIAGQAQVRGGTASLVFRETTGAAAEVGRLTLCFEQAVGLPDGELTVWRTVAGWDGCVTPLRRDLYYGWKKWRRLRDGGRHPEFQQFKQLLVYYICPRPVALVTVMDRSGPEGRLFPMDLLVQTPGSFVAALKNTNRTIEQVRRTRRMVVSWIPFSLVPHAYALAGAHHGKETDWDHLPFALAPSPRFGQLAPAPALAVVELEVDRILDMGSHSAIIGTPAQVSERADGLAMHHVSGLYQERRSGR